MTFKMEDAAKVAKHYQFLIGRDFDNKAGQYPINYVIVSPHHSEYFQRFLDCFSANPDNKIALRLSGFDTSKMMVLGMHFNKFSNLMLYEDIDNFLESNKMEKDYLNEDFFKD